MKKRGLSAKLMLAVNIISWAAAVLLYIIYGRDYYKRKYAEKLKQKN